METEGSLPHLQVPATCLYPEPARSSPHPHIPLPEKFILILSSHLRLGLPTGRCTPLRNEYYIAPQVYASNVTGTRDTVYEYRVGL